MSFEKCWEVLVAKGLSKGVDLGKEDTEVTYSRDQLKKQLKSFYDRGVAHANEQPTKSNNQPKKSDHGDLFRGCDLGDLFKGFTKK